MEVRGGIWPHLAETMGEDTGLRQLVQLRETRLAGVLSRHPDYVTATYQRST